MHLFLYLLLALRVCSTSYAEWMHHITLDHHSKYHLRWSFDDSKKQITFMVEVETRGWIGFGISPNGAMTGSDLIIAWIDSNAVAHFHVHYIFYFYFKQIFIFLFLPALKSILFFYRKQLILK